MSSFPSIRIESGLLGPELLNLGSPIPAFRLALPASRLLRLQRVLRRFRFQVSPLILPPPVPWSRGLIVPL